MAVSLLTYKWSPHKELLAKQVERIHRLIRREQIQAKLLWIPRSNNVIADHLTLQVRAAGEDLVIWAREEEEATSAIVQAVLAVEACCSCGCFAMMHAELPMICEESFHTNVKKGCSDPIEDILLLYFHTH